MKKQADYIKRIEIKRLWGRKDISWELRPDVEDFLCIKYGRVVSAAMHTMNGS